MASYEQIEAPLANLLAHLEKRTELNEEDLKKAADDVACMTILELAWALEKQSDSATQILERRNAILDYMRTLHQK